MNTLIEMFTFLFLNHCPGKNMNLVIPTGEWKQSLLNFLYFIQKVLY